jgi:hypothetical protein
LLDFVIQIEEPQGALGRFRFPKNLGQQLDCESIFFDPQLGHIFSVTISRALQF